MLLSRHLFPVFAGSIGENTPRVRSMALEFPGLTLDPDCNSQDEGGRLISADNSAVKIWVIAANEEWTIAQGICRLASGSEAE